MAKKISQLTQATEVKSDDVTVIVQDGETKKLPLNMMVTKQDIENKKVAGLAKLDEIEATYENDTYTPTITVKNKSSVKTGEGDEVDYSANVMDGHVKSAILKGNTGYRDIDTGEILEAFEEGRNLELVSVKMPVLTTTGKNLFDISKHSSLKQNTDCVITATWFGSVNPTIYNLKPNTKYTLSFLKYGTESSWVAVEIDGVFSNNNDSNYSKTFTTNSTGIVKIRIGGNNPGNIGHKITNIQLEESPTPTTYEPYKSNILTVNEPIELRGIGEIKDELNLLTGELVQRIKETTLDGNESWQYTATFGDYMRFRLKLNDCKMENYNFIMENMPFIDDSNLGSFHYSVDRYGGYLFVFLNKTELSSQDEVGCKQYFQTHPTKLQYELSTESIKTVDLMPSGTHPSTTPYCWKNGHIQLSSSGLLPNLEYSVVTSRAGQINQNATMIVKNDKRIFDLEILLAGGLVNTTYQALTLQNQVETGLSKVSLSSETEPDYLLYHMIMKLIEEKAYKLDDLTEKVSVFYLYEKLSDEQFETIYSALYPFVEDEIVEEPVVEELPEVVEDEVIM